MARLTDLFWKRLQLWDPFLALGITLNYDPLLLVQSCSVFHLSDNRDFIYFRCTTVPLWAGESNGTMKQVYFPFLNTNAQDIQPLVFGYLTITTLYVTTCGVWHHRGWHRVCNPPFAHPSMEPRWMIGIGEARRENEHNGVWKRDKRWKTNLIMPA